MGTFAIKPLVAGLAWLSAGVIVTLNVKLVVEFLSGWAAGPGPFWVKTLVVGAVAFAGCMLLYITLRPLFKIRRKERVPVPHGGFDAIPAVAALRYKRVAVTVDFSSHDHDALGHAINLGGRDAEYVLIHVVESAGALMFGKETRDYESQADEKNLKLYIENLRTLGYRAEMAIGYGNPKKVIVQKVREHKADLLVMGAHGHRGVKDLFFGATVDAVRHALPIPILVVR
jgi:manganese transport protein